MVKFATISSMQVVNIVKFVTIVPLKIWLICNGLFMKSSKAQICPICYQKFHLFNVAKTHYRTTCVLDQLQKTWSFAYRK